jgi:ATP-dependent DNA helicase DinG
VFDEGHHLFDAADSTFAAALTGQETIELRRWIVGPEGKSRGRRRGLAARLMDVASYDEAGALALDAAVRRAGAAAGDGWLQRIAEGHAVRPAREAARGRARHRLRARHRAGCRLRHRDRDGRADGALVEAAAPPAVKALERCCAAGALGKRLEAVLEDAPDWLDAQARARVEGAIGGLTWRAQTLAAWIALLARLGGPADPDFVDWLAVERVDGREYRHRPPPPLARSRPARSPKAVLKPAHGVLVTSATLRGGEDWSAAERAPAPATSPRPAQRFAAESPFDYAANSEVLIVTDVKRGDVARARRRLCAADRGGGRRHARPVHRHPAAEGGPRPHRRPARPRRLPLYAQHVDPIDTGTLGRHLPRRSARLLLGTDALRDGVDVPGHSLRLVVMEGVPWPRPTVLHAARRAAGGGSAYDDRVVRARLAQAFGRLIRRKEDRGMFVLLSGRDADAPAHRLSARRPDPPRAARRSDRAGAVAAFNRRAFGHQARTGERPSKGAMKTLTLLRHAKSTGTIRSRATSTGRSTARPPRGAHDRARDARARARLRPVHRLARRARARDAGGGGAAMGAARARFDQRIYLASPETLLEIVQRADDGASGC